MKIPLSSVEMLVIVKMCSNPSALEDALNLSSSTEIGVLPLIHFTCLGFDRTTFREVVSFSRISTSASPVIIEHGFSGNGKRETVNDNK